LEQKERSKGKKEGSKGNLGFLYRISTINYINNIFV
jgi:hypothetical protein